MIHIVSYTKWPEHRGGVPLYNHYLLRIFPEAKLWCWEDMKKSDKGFELEETKAFVLSKWLERTGKIKRGDVIIGEGIWGSMGLDQRKYKLVCVAHGLWIGTRRGAPIVLHQKKNFNRAAVVVACSNSVKVDALHYYGVPTYLIPTSVDTDFWIPDKKKRYENTVLWQRKWNEVSGLKERVVKYLPEFKHVEINTYEDEAVRDLYRSCGCFVHATTYEGNAFAILKALACDCPVATTDVGIGKDQGKNSVILSVVSLNTPMSLDARAFCMAEKIKLAIKNYIPGIIRESFMRECSFQSFCDRWKSLVEGMK